jgi:twitching motility protein PilT
MKDLADLLINLHMLSPEQLETARFLQSMEEPRRRLEDVLLEQNMIDPARLQQVLEIHGAMVEGKVTRKAPGAERPAPRGGPARAGRSEPAVAVQAVPPPVGPAARAPPQAVPRRPELPPRTIPRQNLVHDLLRSARDRGASALHVTSGAVARVRLHGALVPLEMDPIAPQTCRDHVLGLLSDAQYEEFSTRRSVDFCSQLGSVGRVRVNIFAHRNGVAGTFRLVAERILSFDDLGLPPAVREFVNHKRGLALITGPSGSGKSTTLAALVDVINKTSTRHVVTLEDPIECFIENEAGLITQREVRAHSRSFATALHAALREDPEVIVVGELLDPESVSTAITAAETGHLVLGTCHTRNVPGTILRILDQFPSHKRAHVRTMLAGTLRAVLCQELVPGLNGGCRHLAYELVIVNKAVSNLIREDRLWQIPMVMQLNQPLGMQTMDDSLDRLVRAGSISREEAVARSSDATRFSEPEGGR